MPHFIIDCSENIIKTKPAEEIMKIVHDAAEGTGLFEKGDIKVRINSFTYFNNGNTKNEFLHIFGYVMEGRTPEQKANLSKVIMQQLKSILPALPILSMNVDDFEKETYCNKSMV
jgi:5-carboxymethyl-2-hydroxymuconate isomerase